MKVEELRRYVWESLCIGYDTTENQIKADCIIDLDEIIDLIYQKLKKGDEK